MEPVLPFLLRGKVSLTLSHGSHFLDYLVNFISFLFFSTVFLSVFSIIFFVRFLFLRGIYSCIGVSPSCFIVAVSYLVSPVTLEKGSYYSIQQFGTLLQGQYSTFLIDLVSSLNVVLPASQRQTDFFSL